MAITGGHDVVAVRDRDITSRECTTIAIGVATTGAMEPKIVCVLDLPMIEAGNVIMVRAGQAIAVTLIIATATPTGRQETGNAEIPVTVRTVTARVPQIAMGFHFARAMPGHAPIRSDAERERRRT